MTWDGNLKIDLVPMPEPEPAMVSVIMDDLAREVEEVIREEHPDATIIRLGEPTYTKDAGGQVTLNFQIADPNFDRMTLDFRVTEPNFDWMTWPAGPFKDDAK